MLLYNVMNKYYSFKNKDYRLRKQNRQVKNGESVPPIKLDPNDIPKYVNQLLKPRFINPVFQKDGDHSDIER